MSNSKAKKILSVDARGRVTLPSELREGVDSFSVEKGKEGILRLVPQKSVSLEEAELLSSLKASVREVKKGRTRPMPSEWLED